MFTAPSPLRYPGGKAAILNMVSKIITDNGLEDGDYAEPYAGGAGLALSLLFNDMVSTIHLNDLDRSIWCFWDAVLNHTDQFIDKIRSTDVNMDEWYKQRHIQQNKSDYPDFDLAFSSFFLNRTNRSGIILKAGVIGGLNQEGKYKLDCRYNKDNLIERIQRISQYKHRIKLYNLDAVEFIKTLDASLPSNSLFCIDPPYFVKGATLYTNFYNPEDHKELADLIMGLKHSWILTYDDAEQIQRLYQTHPQYKFNLNYFAAKKRKGTELLITSKDIEICPTLELDDVA